MKKQIYDLTPEDLKANPVWYFPMDEEGDSDEATVVPATADIARDQNTMIVVAATFITAKNESLEGYLYWFENEEIETVQPVVFLNGAQVGFWFGIIKPKLSEMPRFRFPIIAHSKDVFGLNPISIVIEGYGYYEGRYPNYTKTCIS